MTQQVSDPPDSSLTPVTPPERNANTPFSRAGIFTMLVLISLLLLLFSGLFVFGLVQPASSQVESATATVSVHQASPTTKTNHTRALTPTSTPGVDATPTIPAPIFPPDNTILPQLQLPGGHYVIYEYQGNLYVVSSTGDLSEEIPTPDYVYTEAVPPILTPSGQLLYSGNNGIWLTDIFGGTPMQIAPLASGQVITSMALSEGGKMIAWSTEPANGNGVIDIHAGSLANPSVVYEQSALDCPCYRIFSFMNGTTARADKTLLLTDDRGSHEAVQYGLWSLDLSTTPATPQSILDDDPEQGPLTLAPHSNTLLYSSSEGAAPVPTDNSVPTDVATLSYANSLDLTTLNGSPLTMGTSQVVLPEQNDLSNSAAYHWVTTPIFSPDTHTLAYVEFSSDSQPAYDRHSAIYTVQISGSGSHLHAGKPQLLVTSTSRLLELGPWFNSHILTFYANGAIFALDIQSQAVTTLAMAGGYAHIIAVIGSDPT